MRLHHEITFCWTSNLKCFGPHSSRTFSNEFTQSSPPGKNRFDYLRKFSACLLFGNLTRKASLGVLETMESFGSSFATPKRRSGKCVRLGYGRVGCDLVCRCWCRKAVLMLLKIEFSPEKLNTEHLHLYTSCVYVEGKELFGDALLLFLLAKGRFTNTNPRQRRIHEWNLACSM